MNDDTATGATASAAAPAAPAAPAASAVADAADTAAPLAVARPQAETVFRLRSLRRTRCSFLGC